MLRCAVLGLTLLTATPCLAVTYKDWASWPEGNKRGYIVALADYMAGVTKPDEQPPYSVTNGYRECLKGTSDILLVKQAEAYVARNPSAFSESMVAVGINMLAEICKLMVDRAKGG
jgi:hypothetical protein